MRETNRKAPDYKAVAGISVLRNFDAYSSIVELVELEGRKYILKTVDAEEAWNEKRFLQKMKQQGLPTLELIDYPGLAENQILLEYIPGSKTIDSQDPEQVKKWGSMIRQMHNLKYDGAFRINSKNQEQKLDWNTHLIEVIDEAVDSRLGGWTELSDGFLEQARSYVHERLNITNPEFTLIHGDLHYGNTLLRNDEVILYDKSSELFAGDPLYDLTIVMTHFPNGLYVTTDNESEVRDSGLLEAFMEGYGDDFIRSQKDKLDLYMVIRALDRYPNPFEIFNKEIIEKIIGK